LLLIPDGDFEVSGAISLYSTILQQHLRRQSFKVAERPPCCTSQH